MKLAFGRSSPWLMLASGELVSEHYGRYMRTKHKCIQLRRVAHQGQVPRREQRRGGHLYASSPSPHLATVLTQILASRHPSIGLSQRQESPRRPRRLRQHIRHRVLLFARQARQRWCRGRPFSWTSNRPREGIAQGLCW